MLNYQNILFLPTLIVTLFACKNESGQNTPQNEPKLIIATAANVQFAMKEIEAAFEKAHSIDLTIIIGSSGKLTAQIQQGAPYDVLVSANKKYPQTLYEIGLATDMPRTYALGSLVLWTLKKDFDLRDSLSILKKESIKKIAIANPKNAPYGEQAIQTFQNAQLLENIQNKLVYGESIAQVNQYILSKTCEIGITAKSVVLSPDLQGKGLWQAINPSLYIPIEQGIIITKYGQERHPKSANQFYQFLFSEKAQTIFKKYGYFVPSLQNKN